MLKAKTHFFKNLDLNTVLTTSGRPDQFTGTKLVATIGPSCHEVDVLASLLEGGVVAARVDLTWGPLNFHRKSLSNLQEAMKRTKRLCATILDCLGRELVIRGQCEENEQGYPWVTGRNEVTVGEKITITTSDDAEPARNVLPIMYKKFTSMTQKGDTIFIGRYLASGADAASLFLEVLEVTKTDVICEAKNNAVLEGLLCVFHAERSTDGCLNLQNDLPLISDFDKECIKALSEEVDIDYLAIPYTRSAADVITARTYLDSIGLTSTKVLAKVESRQGLLNFQGILAQADSIIISRGNLGLDCVPEKMALIQKTMIQACNLVGKPVLITRVMDTMVSTPRPTRAEATDVANAVLDGVDGILLGAETLRGQYPVECVQTICSICRAAEAVFDHDQHYDYLMDVAQKVVMTMGPSPDESEEEEDLEQLESSMYIGNKPHADSIGVSVKAMAQGSMFASNANLMNLNKGKQGYSGKVTNGAVQYGVGESGGGYSQSPLLSKLETIASSAVRAAAKVAASLIIVYTSSGKTAALVAKYRPPVPILTLVVPTLTSDNLKWRIVGRSTARQCLLHRCLMPMLATPRPSGDALLNEAIRSAKKMGMVRPGDHVVAVQRIHDDFCVKILNVDDIVFS